MTYRKIKKVIASILIATLLAPNLVQIDFSYGDDFKKEHDLVLLLVEKTLFETGSENKTETLTGKIYRYAEDIRKKSDQTKTKIILIDSAEKTAKIQHLLEKYYLEGETDTAQTEVNKLKGVVLIGDIPFPVARYKEYHLPTIFPYVDFVDPLFIWNEKTEQFELNSQNLFPQAEIWHGLIQAPQAENAESELKSYFDKNHAFQTGQVASKFDQKVFYADLIEENTKFNSSIFGNYLLRNQYIEDLAYLRFNKHFAQKILGSLTADKETKVNLPDLQSKMAIEKFLSPYAQVVQNYLQYLNSFVEGSGRWTKKDVDSLPALITKLDALFLASNAPDKFDLSLKNINTHFEKSLDQLVEKSWQKDLTMLVGLISDRDFGAFIGHKKLTFENFVNGTAVRSLKSAEDCLLYRGTPYAENVNFAQQIEFNRLYDPASAGDPEDQCERYGECCGNNLEKPEKCQPDSAAKPIKSTVAGIEKTGIANALACKKLNLINPDYGFGYGDNTIFDYQTHTFPSVVKHNEPRNSTILEAVKNSQVQPNLPADDPRYISFQNYGDGITEIEYLNFFEIKNTTGKNDLETIKKLVKDYISNYAQYVDQKITEQNLAIFKTYLTKLLGLKLKTYPLNFSLTAENSLSFATNFEFETQYQNWQNAVLSFLQTKTGSKNGLTALTEYLKNGRTDYNADLKAIFRTYFPREECLTFEEFFARDDLILDLRLEKADASKNSLPEIVFWMQVQPQEKFAKIAYLPADYWLQQMQAYGEEAVYKVVQWYNASLDEKHEIVFKNYLNQVTPAYPASAPNGYESFYLRAEGGLDYIDLSIKNSATEATTTLADLGLNSTQNDTEWNKLFTDQKNAEETEYNEILAQALAEDGCGSLTEGVELPDWFDTIQCWLDSLGKTYQSTPYPSDFEAQIEQEFQALQSADAELQIALIQEPVALEKYDDWQKIYVRTVEGLDLEEIELAVSEVEGSPKAKFMGENPVKLVNGEGFTYVQGLLPETQFLVYVKNSSTYKSNTIQLNTKVSVSALPLEENVEVVENTEIANEPLWSLPKLSAQQGNKLHFVNPPSKIDYNSEAEITLELRDANGSPIFDASKVEIKLTEASQKYASLLTEASLDFSGKARHILKLKTFRETGVIHLLAESTEGKFPSTGIEIKVADLLTKNEISELNPQILYATLLGGSYADLAQTDTLANRLLFSAGKTQAVTTLQGENEVYPLGLKVYPTGGMEITNTQYQPVVTSILPLQISVFNQSNLQKELSYQVGFAEEKINLGEFTTALDLEKAGVYIDFTDKELLKLTNGRSSMLLQKGAEEILEVSNQGKLILNPKYSLEIKTTLPDYLVFDLVFEAEKIATVFLFQTQVQTILSQSTNVNQFFATAGTNGAKGWSISNTAEEKQKINLSSRENLTSAKTKKGVGWTGDYKNQLLFASQNSVGEATQNYTSVFEVLLGDPTIKLKEKTAPSSNGFDQTLGTPILTNQTQQLAKTLPFNFNGDAYEDVALIYEDGYIELLKGKNDRKFEDKRELAYFAQSIQDAQVFDFKKDGFEDILLVTPENALFLLQNENEKITLQELKLNFNSTLKKFELAQMSDDANPDLVTAFSNGDLKIFYGTAEGIFTATGVLVDQIAGNLSSANLAEEVLLSSPSFKTLATEKQITLDLSPLPDEIKATENTAVFVSALEFPDLKAQKTVQSLSEENLDLGQILEYTISFESATPKTRIDLTNFIPANFTYLPKTLKFKGCGEKVDLTRSVRTEGYPFLISAIDLTPSEICEIQYQVKITATPQVNIWIEDAEVGEYKKDGRLDIGVNVEGNTSGQVKYLISQEPFSHEYLKIYTDKAVTEIPEALDNTDADANGIPDRLEKDADGDGVPDFFNSFVSDYQKGETQDSDGDGLPDAWDYSNEKGKTDSLEELDSSLQNTAEFLEGGCQGGCLNIPINYAGLVPGPILAGALGNFSERLGIKIKDLPDSMVMPIFAWGHYNMAPVCVLPSPAPTIPQPIWLPQPAYSGIVSMCTNSSALTSASKTSWQNSQGRIYLSPTLTGGMGMAVCSGAKYPNGKCFVTALDSIVGNLCDAFKISQEELKVNSRQTVHTDGQSLFSVGGGAVSNNGTVLTQSSGGYGVDFALNNFAFSKLKNKNRIVKAMGNVFTDWFNKQIEELSGAMFDLPTVHFYYPNLDRVFDTGEEKDVPKTSEKGLDGLKNAYEVMKTVPFVSIKRQSFSIPFPYVDKETLNQFRTENEDWKNEANDEVKIAKNAWKKNLGAPEEAEDWEEIIDIRDCDLSGAELSAECEMKIPLLTTMLEADQMINNVDKNLTTLDLYADFPREVLQYKGSLLLYLTQVTHNLNQIMNGMGGWIVRNAFRYNLWKQMILTITEILKDWQKIFDLALNYKNSCETCQAETYQYDMWSMLGSHLPQPPILTLPRWPDISLDASQTNADYKIVLPRINFTPMPLDLPKLPEFSLPKAPGFDWNFSLPGIPLLPEPPNLPDLPDLPSFTLPQLPDLPPPPKIPAIDMRIKGFIEGIDTLLRVYCLIKKGFWMYDEATLKSTIEALTARSSGFVNGFDFLHLEAGDFKIAGYDLLVESRVNLKSGTDFITNVVDEAVQTWDDQYNRFWDKVYEKESDFERKFESVLKIKYPQSFKDRLDGTKEWLDQMKEGVDSKLENMQEKVDEAEGNMDTGLQRREQKLQDLQEYMENERTEVQNKIDESEENLDDSLTQILQEMQKTIAQQSEVKMDLAMLEDLESPNLRRIQKMHETLLSYQKELEQEIQLLEETDDLSAIAFVPQKSDIELASLSENFEITAMTEDVQEFASISQAEIAQLQNPQPRQYLAQTDTNATILTENQNTENSLSATPEYKGVYIYDEATKQAQALLDYAEETDLMGNLAPLNYDQDADKDIIYSMGADLYLKENFKENKTTVKPYPYAPQISDFATLSEPKQAVKNYRVEQFGNQTVTVAWSKSQTDGLTGYLIENADLIDSKATIQKDYFYLALSPQVANVSLNDRAVTIGETLTGALSLKINQKIALDFKQNEHFTLGLNDDESYQFNLPNGFYYSSIFAVFADGTLGTVSPQILLAPQIAGDVMEPLIFAPRELNIYLKQKGLLEDNFFLDDSEKIDFTWSTTEPQSITKVADGLEIGPYTKPQKFDLKLTVTDEAKNQMTGETQVNVIAPNLTLEASNLTSNQQVSGQTQPLLPSIPIALYRNRFGKTKIIQTPSADSQGKYFTDAQGKYSISDFETDAGVTVKNSANEEIAYIHAPTGQIEFKQNGYTKKVIPAFKDFPTRVVILNSANKIIANQYFVADYNNDVALEDFAFEQNSVKGLQGVHLFDAQNTDIYQFASLPGDAPFFPGGAVIFDKNTEIILATINVDGKVYLPTESNLQLTLKENDFTDPVVLEIRDNANLKLGEIYIAVPDKKELLEILPEKNWSQLLTQIFAPLQKIKRPLLASLNTSENLQFNSTHLIAQLPFNDINEDHPAYEAIKDLYERQILNGYADGTVQPDSKISRAEFVKIALGATTCLDCTRPTIEEKTRYDSTQPFPDVFTSAWYYYCVAKGKEKKMITGYGDGFFRPEQNISRAEAVAVLMREAGVAIEKMPSRYFMDVPDYAWYRDYVFTAVQLGMISAKYAFVAPDEQITRGEFAMMAHKLLDIKDCRLTDTDGDGMPDYWEIQNNLNPNKALDASLDNDNDGIVNFREFQNKTNPNQAETEVCPYLNNPNQKNTDGDASIDVCDEDIDNDGVKNVLGIYNSEGKLDEAKVSVSTDNCVFVINPDQIDQNANGKGDACDSITSEKSEITGSSGGIVIIPPEKELDLCPNIPGNNQGCPDFSEFVSTELPQKYGIFIVPGDPSECYFLDYVADLHTGDKIFTAVSSEDNQEIWSKSEEVAVSR